MAFFPFFNKLFVTIFDYFDLLWQNWPKEKIFNRKINQKFKKNQTLCSTIVGFANYLHFWLQIICRESPYMTCTLHSVTKVTWVCYHSFTTPGYHSNHTFAILFKQLKNLSFSKAPAWICYDSPFLKLFSVRKYDNTHIALFGDFHQSQLQSTV
jgi:hypothetical protein